MFDLRAVDSQEQLSVLKVSKLKEMKYVRPTGAASSAS